MRRLSAFAFASAIGGGGIIATASATTGTSSSAAFHDENDTGSSSSSTGASTLLSGSNEQLVEDAAGSSTTPWTTASNNPNHRESSSSSIHLRTFQQLQNRPWMELVNHRQSGNSNGETTTTTAPATPSKSFETCHLSSPGHNHLEEQHELDMGVLAGEDRPSKCSASADVCILPNVIGYDALSSPDDDVDNVAMGICYPRTKLHKSYWHGIEDGTTLHVPKDDTTTHTTHDRNRNNNEWFNNPIHRHHRRRELQKTVVAVEVGGDQGEDGSSGWDTDNNASPEWADLPPYSMNPRFDFPEGDDETTANRCEAYCREFGSRPLVQVDYEVESESSYGSSSSSNDTSMFGGSSSSSFAQILSDCMDSYIMIYSWGMSTYPSWCPIDLSIPMNCWDTSLVTDMSRAFATRRNFNWRLDCWDTSGVTDMHEMFEYASSFNQDIGSWDTSSVTDLHQMFYIAPSFNQHSIAKWNTSSVTDTSRMFGAARLFDGPIGGWDTSRVKDLSNMFFAARSFNQPIGYWDVSQVTNLYGLFIQANSFNHDLSSWNTSAVRSMRYTFRNAYVFDQPLADWDVSGVTTMASMFSGAKAFNRPLEQQRRVSTSGSSPSGASSRLDGNRYWNVSSVTSMKRMFSAAVSFDQCLGSWAGSLSQHESATADSTSRMFERTACPNHANVNVNVNNATTATDDYHHGTPAFDRGPWCRGPTEGCFELESYTTLEGTLAYARKSSLPAQGAKRNDAKSGKSNKSRAKSDKSDKKRYLRSQ